MSEALKCHGEDENEIEKRTHKYFELNPPGERKSVTELRELVRIDKATPKQREALQIFDQLKELRKEKPKTELRVVRGDENTERRQRLTKYISGDGAKIDAEEEKRKRNDAIAARMAEARRQVRDEKTRRKNTAARAKLVGLRGNLEPVANTPKSPTEISGRIIVKEDDNDEGYRLEDFVGSEKPSNSTPADSITEDGLEQAWFDKISRADAIVSQATPEEIRTVRDKTAREDEAAINAAAGQIETDEEELAKVGRENRGKMKEVIRGKTVKQIRGERENQLATEEKALLAKTRAKLEIVKEIPSQANLLRDVLSAREQIMNIKIGGFLGFGKKELRTFFPYLTITTKNTENALKSFIDKEELGGIKPEKISLAELRGKIKNFQDQVLFDNFVEAVEAYQKSFSREFF